MLTPQELQEKKFAKAVFGGYDMAEVDAFLDELTADYENLFKDSAVLKSKLKTLAEKVEEYRSVDEEMRQTLAMAKRSAEEMKAEAERYAAEVRAEADKYAADTRSDADKYATEVRGIARRESEQAVANARADAEKKLDGIRASIAQEQKRFEEARAASRRFAAEAVVLNRKQLDVLRELMESTPAPAAEPEEIEIEPAKTEPAVAAWLETELELESPTKKIPTIRHEEIPEDERITERHAEEDTADAAADAADIDFVGSDAEPTKRFSVTEPTTIRFEAIRRVDVGGETVEIDAENEKQSAAEAFRQAFGGDDDDGE